MGRSAPARLSIDSSPCGIVPATIATSCPSLRCPAASSSTASAAPPRLSRVITCTIFMGCVARLEAQGSATVSSRSGCLRRSLRPPAPDQPAEEEERNPVESRQRCGTCSPPTDRRRLPRRSKRRASPIRPSSKSTWSNACCGMYGGRPAGSSEAGCPETRARIGHEPRKLARRQQPVPTGSRDRMRLPDATADVEVDQALAPARGELGVVLLLLAEPLVQEAEVIVAQEERRDADGDQHGECRGDRCDGQALRAPRKHRQHEDADVEAEQAR